MTNRGPIYCIGDSHASFFSGQDKIQPPWPKSSNNILNCFRTFVLGPVLAYNLCEYGTTSKGREKLFRLLDGKFPLAKREIPPESKVLLCFGEIDCRAHLLKQAELQKRSIASVVEECVERYFSLILEVQRLGYELLVWNVIPSSRHDYIPDKEFPVHGTSFERNHVTRLFNTSLSELCLSTKAKFVSIFDDLVDEEGLTRMEYYYDYVHLSQKAMPLALAKIKEIVGDSFLIKNLTSVENRRKNKSFFNIRRLMSRFYT